MLQSWKENIRPMKIFFQGVSHERNREIWNFLQCLEWSAIKEGIIFPPVIPLARMAFFLLELR
jgi:hypothetical protein